MKQEMAARLIEAADAGGTIQAAQMVVLAPGRPELHTATTLRNASIALDVQWAVQAAMGLEWAQSVSR